MPSNIISAFARLAGRVLGLATYRSLLIVRNFVVSIGVLAALTMGIAMLMSSCAETASLLSAESRGPAKAPAPGLSDRDRLPLYEDDEAVTIIGDDGRPTAARWGDVKAEAELQMLPGMARPGE